MQRATFAAVRIPRSFCSQRRCSKESVVITIVCGLCCTLQGCFWGVEQKFAQHFRSAGLQTAVGYTGGTVPKPTYERVRSKEAWRVLVHSSPRELAGLLLLLRETL